MGSGCRKTISWKNYYIKPKLRFLKTIFNFMILIFAAIMWVLHWCQRVYTLSLGIWKVAWMFPFWELDVPRGPQKWILWHSPLRCPRVPRASWWPLIHMPEPHTLAYRLQVLSPGPEKLRLQRKMGPAHKFLLHMVRASKQVNKFLNAFLRPGIINTLSCYHD